MIGYTCKYTPVELLEALGGEPVLLNGEAESFRRAEELVHPNLCSHAKALLEHTRGLAELSRLGTAMGARPLTFMGLSGLGDLVLTCTGGLSRNRQVGIRLGRGEKLGDIVASLGMVAEGVKTAVAARDLAQRLRVSVPVTEAMCLVLHENADPAEAVRSLMERPLREE